jgi:Protein of unknown function (DUF1688)
VTLKNIDPAAKALLTAAAVRRSSNRLLDMAIGGSLPDWQVDPTRLPATADYVAQIVRQRYPSLNLPLHSRWRHFEFGGRNLWNELAARAGWPVSTTQTRADKRNPTQAQRAAEAARGSPSTAKLAARARAAFDLAIVSVVLDAGAGPSWRYRDAATGIEVTRSEGLALASLRWFESGGLSSDPHDALRVDATALTHVDATQLQEAFQVSDANPLVGAQQRTALLNRLGAAMQARPDMFAVAGDFEGPSGTLALLLRPAGLFDHFEQLAVEGTLRAGVILEKLLEALGPIWENRPALAGVSLGDCWPHPALRATASPSNPGEGYAALHKLSQWLTYSLVEPLQDAGTKVIALDELTGLAEYRNGGLFTDMRVLNARTESALQHSHLVSDPFVVGWRALTVALLDRLAPLVGQRLGLAEDSFLLARVLEGGTWAAGRQLAREKRGDGSPPFQIQSDGTVL